MEKSEHNGIHGITKLKIKSWEEMRTIILDRIFVIVIMLLMIQPASMFNTIIIIVWIQKMIYESVENKIKKEQEQNV